jgi:hypothetical protein
MTFFRIVPAYPCYVIQEFTGAAFNDSCCSKKSAAVHILRYGDVLETHSKGLCGRVASIRKEGTRIQKYCWRI